MRHVFLILLSAVKTATLYALLSNPVIIFPGFGNDMIDYINPLQKGIENGLLYNLEALGIQATVLPIKRYEWLKIIGGVTDSNYWKYECLPESLFRFYYNKAYKEIETVKNLYGKDPIIIGHSAGGWLARSVVDQTNVRGLVTLGTPHLPPQERQFDTTRGSLKYVNDNYPGAYMSKKGMFYVSVASDAIVSNRTAPFRSIEYFAHQSYKQVIGKDIDNEIIKGDGVVPLVSSHLEGALQITLNDVYHSISAPNFNWYGGKSVLNKWLPQVVKLANGR